MVGTQKAGPIAVDCLAIECQTVQFFCMQSDEEYLPRGVSGEQ
jgi:hypothetical protein